MLRALLLAATVLLAACGDDADPAPDATAAQERERFLADNAARPGVIVTDTGLQYEVLRPAEGAMPGPTSVVTVDYVGTLTDGTRFDSSYARGEPATFPLSGTIPGFEEGVQLMSVGSRFRFVMPAYLAYGSAGAGTDVPPDATLVFEVELLEINA